MMVMIGLVTILPIVIVNKLFAEETRGHLDQLYITKVTRGQLYWTTILLAVFAGIVGIGLASAGLGEAAIIAMKNKSAMNLIDFLAAGYNFLPSVLFYIGLAALALGWLPKFGKVIYIYLGYSFTLNYFGGILNLPNWFSKTALQSWIPQLPAQEFDGTVFSVITAISICFLFIGYLGYKRRDLVEGT